MGMLQICGTCSTRNIKKCCRSAYWFLTINLPAFKNFAATLCKYGFILNKYNELRILQPVAKGVVRPSSSK